MTASLDDLLPPIDDDELSILPSALGQFIRFEQCHRLFRLNLHPDDTVGRVFTATGTGRELVQPLLSATGSDWEVGLGEMLNVAGWDVFDVRNGDSQALASHVRRTRHGDRRVVREATISGALDGWRIDSARPDLIFIERTESDELRLLVADLKSSRDVRLEHRLQVAMYAMILAQRFPDAEITEAVIYRPPVEPPDLWSDEQRCHLGAARSILRLDTGAMLALAVRPERYHDQIRRSILATGSLARSIAAADFSRLPYHVTSRCDGCAYSQFCLSSCRSASDLSLIPYLTERTKRSLEGATISTIESLASIRSERQDAYASLVANPTIGPQLSELTQRARSFLAWRDGGSPDTWLKDGAHSTLPVANAVIHPNLIRIYLDLQVDASQCRVYLAAAQISCLAVGAVRADRERLVLEMTDGPPSTDEAEAKLIRAWLQQILQAIRELASPDADGNASAPIHFYMWDDAQRAILADLVNRQHDAVFGIEAVTKLMMQTAAFDSNNLSIVAAEVRAQRALPMLCQTLHSVAPWFGFKWPDEIKSRFRYRVFDALDKDTDDRAAQLVPFRARFRSELPTEYAYVAWNEHTSFRSAEQPDPDTFLSGWGLYGHRTPDDVLAFEASRLEALRAISGGLNANGRARKSSFSLSFLERLKVRPADPIEAVREFIAIERHQELAEWRHIRSQVQATRVLSGDTLVVRYRDADQTPDVRIRIREARDRYAKWQERRAEDPQSRKEKDEKWSLSDLEVRLRVDVDELPDSLGLETALLNTRIKENSFVTLAPARQSYRPPDGDDEITYQSTARQILGGFRGVVKEFGSDGQMAIRLRENGVDYPGFIFRTRTKPFDDGECWVIDESPDSWPWKRQIDVTEQIRSGLAHTPYAWITGSTSEHPLWSEVEAQGQRRYLDGLVLLSTLDERVPTFEPSKHQLIGSGGGERMTLVQGPPGTGKSTTTGYALWARVQGALAAGRKFRVAVACKTHAATDVLIRSILKSQVEILDIARCRGPEVEELIDQGLRSVPVYRYEPDDGKPPSGAKVVQTKTVESNLREICTNPYVVVGGTTNAIGKLARKAWKDGDPPWDLLIVDEASQMSLPEFLTAGVGLKPEGTIIVVGDHRQMPPIIKANWEEGDSVVVDPYAAYRSVFDTIRFSPQPKVEIKFSESFRIHRDVAEYLRREVYRFDQIDFFSDKEPAFTTTSDFSFARAVLQSPQPLILITHGERDSQQRNDLEQKLTEVILGALHRLDERLNLGVVVPHRAQRAALRKRLLELTGDEDLANSVDTIERFQGNERDIIVYSATESDPAYLRDTGMFLFDPRRLTVAISRATRKLIVIAAESIFEYLPKDEDSLENSAIWRNLRAYACPDVAWQGELDGFRVTVRRSVALERPDQVGRR